MQTSRRLPTLSAGVERVYMGTRGRRPCVLASAPSSHVTLQKQGSALGAKCVAAGPMTMEVPARAEDRCLRHQTRRSV